MAAGDVLGLLTRVNLAAGAAIILVVALRKVARPRFGARLVYALWLLPMLAAVAVLAPARAVTVAAQAAPASRPIIPFTDGEVPASLTAAASAATLDPKMLILALWLVGVAAAALVMTLLQRRFTAEVRKGAIGPAVVGVLAPRIVTPADFEQKFSGEEQALVLAHERAHIARQDSRLNGLSAAIQCLCWFNPLVHLAAHLMRIDQEMACDETVVIRFPDARRAYAQALVKAQLAIRPLPLGCYWPSGTEHPLLERVAMLKRNDLSRRRRPAGGAALAVLCAATGLAAWSAQPPQVRIAAAPAEVAPAAPAPAAALLPAAAPTAPASAATPAPASAPQASDAPARALAQVEEDRAQLARFAAATPPAPPPARLIPIAASEAQPAVDAAAPRPAPSAVPVRPPITDAQRQTSRAQMECERAAVKAVDDGHSPEDVIAPQVETHCEAEYQAYRQAWIAGAGVGKPEERGWILDNSRRERTRMFIHASRQASARMGDINGCVAAVANQSAGLAFEQVLDRAVQRCGALVPFPVAPIRHTIGAAPDSAAAAPPAPIENHDPAIRTMITFQLRQVLKTTAPQPE
jgi:beta-lactamase regulating signal transducer with metallopeptidase domain